MSISLNDRWLIEAVAVTGRPRSRPRFRLSKAEAVVTWSTIRLAPVTSTRARLESYAEDEPRRSTALPLFSVSAAASTVTLGRPS